jgi:hypothetical protein
MGCGEINNWRINPPLEDWVQRYSYLRGSAAAVGEKHVDRL